MSPQGKRSRDATTQLDFLHKFKRLSPLEPSLGIFGFFLGALLFIGCFFYLDYQAVTRGLITRHAISWPGRAPSPPPAAGGREEEEVVGPNGNGRPGFLDDGGGECDVFDGNWVWDDSYPLYRSQDCSFVDAGFRCLENGRPDSFYTKWRWQPSHCDLPRFDAGLMLEKMRNRRIAFVGDSVGRNQWESLLCMLASAVHNGSSIYEVNGNPITKHTGYLAFRFKDYNCTVEYYRSPFLMYTGRPLVGAPKEVKMTLRVDTMDWTCSQWKDADLLVFNSGHWWNYEKTLRGGCYFQEGKEVKMEMSVETAYRRSIETLIRWMHQNVNMIKTQVFIRTYAPVHFRGGDWKTGGSCHLEKLPELGIVPDSSDIHFKILLEVFSGHSNDSVIASLNLLNVTGLSARRKDGHASLYYLEPGIGPAPLHRQDCSHWCLPGVPDSWNEILYALFLKRESSTTHTTTKSHLGND